MCYRYFFVLSDNEISKIIKNKDLVYKQGEIFPNDDILVLVPIQNKIDFEVKKWGIKGNNLIVNSRIESLNSKFHKIINNKCVVIASGFYEWDINSNKYFIENKDGYLYFAAIYNENNEVSIITKDGRKELNNIHDRVPVTLNNQEIKKYLFTNMDYLSDKNFIITNLDNRISLFN